jgi:regulator of sirC expression with transglutaminase-like and TPR domain
MTTPVQGPRAALAAEARRPEPEFDLARAALLIAQEEYPQLPIETYLARLDQLAERVRDRLADETAPLLVQEELVRTLFGEGGLRGNEEAYYDPRNSFLNDVLDRGLGIPLTLGIVLLEVGWRLDLPLEGVNFPNHFLVRFRGDSVNLLIDPFDKGTARFEDQAQELLDRVYGGTVRMRDDFLRPANRRDMLLRMLRNLKGLYLNVRDYPRALAAVERLMLLAPTAVGEGRDRGMLLARLGRREEALESLEQYLDDAPDAQDVERIKLVMERLRRGDEPLIDEKTLDE